MSDTTPKGEHEEADKPGVGERILHTVKEAVFGAESPAAAVTRILEAPAEAIDPRNADIRAFGPADPPEEVVVPADGDEPVPPPSGEHRERTENAPRR